jgi:hypothetical protein
MSYLNALKSSLVYPTDQDDTFFWSFNPMGGDAPKLGYLALTLDQLSIPPPGGKNPMEA